MSMLSQNCQRGSSRSVRQGYSMYHQCSINLGTIRFCDDFLSINIKVKGEKSHFSGKQCETV